MVLRFRGFGCFLFSDGLISILGGFAFDCCLVGAFVFYILLCLLLLVAVACLVV